MSKDAHDADPPSSAEADLSLKTIMEQQSLINALREMVVAMKSRVAVLEDAAAAAGAARKDALVAHEGAIERLNGSMGLLAGERDAATAKCAELRAALAEGNTRLEEARAQCRLLRQAEEERGVMRSVLNLVESRCREVEMHCKRLEEKIDALSFERSRWKAFAMSVVGRLDGVARERALLYVDQMEREERQRAAGLSVGVPDGGNCSTRIGKDVSSLDSLDMLNLMLPPNTRMSSQLPNLLHSEGCDGNTVSSSLTATTGGGVNGGGSKRRKGGRFLVPF